MNIDEYFHKLEEQVNTNYAIAGEARKIGVDPSSVVDVPIARSLAERVLGLVSVLYPQIQNPKIVERILELEKQYGSLNPAVALTIAEEIAKEKYCTFKDKLQAMEAGIRAALGYLTLGYVSSPIEGFIQLKVCKRADGKEYLAPYYSGPIRSAGTTASCVVLMLIDYLRELFGYAKYDPTENEVKRYVTENQDYHERISNLRHNHLHQITSNIVRENQTICAESLAVKNMIKNHCLAKAIADVSWGELLRQLEYKCEWNQRTFIQVDRYFPSSKTCNKCKYINEGLTLEDRVWTCPKCQSVLDRDRNACSNILEQGLVIHSGSGIESELKQKHEEASLLRESVSHETQPSLVVG